MIDFPYMMLLENMKKVVCESPQGSTQRSNIIITIITSSYAVLLLLLLLLLIALNGDSQTTFLIFARSII
jgi:hypothetical protein